VAQSWAWYIDRAIAFKFALAPQISVLNRNDALIRPNISQLAHTNPQP